MKPDRIDVRHLTTARQDLQRWQSNQKAHDEMCHPEIANLEMPRRIAHLVMHMSKYAGGLMRASIDGDDVAYCKQLVDSGIIAVSASTVLRVNLANYFETAGFDVSSDFSTFSKQLASSKRQDFIANFVIEVGYLAKATEAIDHMEAFPIRETWNLGFPRIMQLTIAEAAHKQIDLRRKATERLQEIRKINQFAKEDAAGMTYDFLER